MRIDIDIGIGIGVGIGVVVGIIMAASPAAPVRRRMRHFALHEQW